MKAPWVLLLGCSRLCSPVKQTVFTRAGGGADKTVIGMYNFTSGRRISWIMCTGRKNRTHVYKKFGFLAIFWKGHIVRRDDDIFDRHTKMKIVTTVLVQSETQLAWNSFNF